jgi:hypothetical protein
MKRIWAAGALVVLALWFGYSLGYHHGKQAERAAWEATEMVGLEGNDGWQMTWSKSSNRWLTNWVKIDRKDRLRVYYSDPHFRMGYEVAGKPVMNTPDLRNTEVR